MSATARAGTLWRLWRAEGTRSIVERMKVDLAVRRRCRSFRRSTGPVPGPLRPRRVTLSAYPPDPRRGGVQLQLLWRWEEEAKLEPSALLYPTHPAGPWRLELAHGGDRRVWVLDQRTPVVPPLGLVDPRPAVAWAMEALGTKPLLHVENLSGLDPEALGAIARRHPTSLYQHDFSTFCVRPHLFEQPHERFCEFSRDSARCVRCLREEWDVERDPLPTQREATRELLTSVRSVIFPSEYLRNETSRLFDLSEETPPTHVVAPGLPETDSFPPPPERRPTDPYRVAFLGGGRAHKGAEIFADLVARLADTPGLEWHVFGGYGLDRLRRLRRSTRVCIHGFYAPGSLAALLRRHRIDLALHLSIVPESYSLTLSECGRAGVSVLAFDKGVYSSRVEIAGLVPFSGQMATDVAGLEARLLTRPGCRIDSAPSSSQAARAMTVLLAAEVP